MSSAAALSRLPVIRFDTSTPLSVRGAWHRLSMLGSLGILILMPWVTTTGCEGTSPPVVHRGIELLLESLHSEPITWLGPLGLLVAALFGLVVRRVRSANHRLLVQFGALIASCAGSFFTFMALAAPTAGEHEEHHAAAAMGLAVLCAFILDALVRTVLGAREAWLARARGPRWRRA